MISPAVRPLKRRRVCCLSGIKADVPKFHSSAYSSSFDDDCNLWPVQWTLMSLNVCGNNCCLVVRCWLSSAQPRVYYVTRSFASTVCGSLSKHGEWTAWGIQSAFLLLRKSYCLKRFWSDPAAELLYFFFPSHSIYRGLRICFHLHTRRPIVTFLVDRRPQFAILWSLISNSDHEHQPLPDSINKTFFWWPIYK